MGEYLSFRKMITPVFIQVIFWIAIAGIVIAALVQIANDAVGAGLLTLIFGPLFARIYAEILMVIFRINDNVAALRDAKTGGAAPTDLT
jgi:hypothetical protein